MGIGKDFIVLMTDLGYRFRDISLLENALTHSSYSNEMKRRGYNARSNEALEFLGDAVLELVISEELFSRYQKDGEGTLTKMRQNLVCESTLARVGDKLKLGDYLNVGTGEESTDVRYRAKVIADALEAVIAAVYIDDCANGRVNYRSVILSLFADEIARAMEKGDVDYKTMLQQFVEKNSGCVLRYEYLESGPEHKKTFTAIAFINNNKVGEGVGTTKRAAEASAAMRALSLFGIIR